MQQLARRHWTPLIVAQQAAQFLVPKDGVRVLDIGSGVGKFCLSAAYYKPNALFYGIEQRKNLVEHAEAAKNVLELPNITFIHGNFTSLDLKQYDHFYFFNSFYEHVNGTPKIDYNVSFSEALYNYYDRYLIRQMEGMPAGTRIVTRCSWEDKIPPSYSVVSSDFDSMLRFLIKK
jgi:cyclopropane fatty-acyl-phospholipid synthase-like methyltransferase